MATGPTGTPTDTSLADAAYREIKQRLLTCRLAPGARFTEKRLALELGYGKTPVREALGRLVAENLITAIPRQGYEVRPVTLQDVDELFEVWRIIGPASCAIAARSLDARAITLLRAGIIWPPDSADRTADDQVDALLATNRAVFRVLGGLVGNSRLTRIHVQLFDELERVLALAYRARNLQPGVRAYMELLLEALEHGDADRASEVVVAGIDGMYRELMTVLPTFRSVRSVPLVSAAAADPRAAASPH